MLDVVFGETSNNVMARSLQTALQAMDLNGTLYLGYPVLSTADSKVFVDALLVSQSHGLVAFDLTSHLDGRPDEDQLHELAERQNQIYASIFNKLNTHRDLRSGRSLAIRINVITCHPALEEIVQEGDVLAGSPDDLPNLMQDFEGVRDEILRPLNAAIQRVSTLRPPKRRENVAKSNSRGAILKRIEKEIANLDQWQNRGAIEYANGPQRI